jgi:hypothetical protein
VRRTPADRSPIVSVSSPSVWPNGDWQVWGLHSVDRSYFSLSLPRWLLAAPSSGSISLSGARGRLADEYGNDARRIDNRNLLGRACSLLADAARLGGRVPAVVEWWRADQPDGVTTASTVDELLATLTADADTGEPRDHLISGWHDQSGFALWYDPEDAWDEN